MAKNTVPSLAFINDRGFLKINNETIRVHKIIKDIIHVSMLSAAKKVRVAFFYQNDSFDAVIPYCLEVLYQTNHVSKRERNHVLLYCGRLYSYFKESYKDSFYGVGNFCNNNFGLGVVRPNGNIKDEKVVYPHGVRTIKTAVGDKFLFSSSYSFFPNKDVAKKIGAVVITPPPSLSNMHKVAQICQWCEENGVPTMTIFDPYPTVRKIKFYQSLGFLPYGWRLPEMKEAAMNAPNKDATPLSNPKRLMVSDPDEVEFVKCGDPKVSSLFNSLNSTLAKAMKNVEPSIYGKDMLMEAVSLSRRLAGLSTPLLEYDKEYFGSMFRKPLSERVDNFTDIVETATDGKGILAEMGKAAHYLAEIKKSLASSNPKFNKMATLIGSLISRKSKAVVLIPTQKEANAFKKALASLKVPITEENLQHAGVDIMTFGADQSELENSKYDMALLATYPFLDKRYLLSKSIAKKTKIVLYPCEESDYKFFNDLYSQIEGQFFTKSRRDEIKSFLSGRGHLKEIKITRITREGGKANTKVETAGRREPREILEVLTDMEKSLDVSAPSIFQEPVGMGTIKKGAGGEIKVSGLKIKFHTGDTIYVREEKTVQVESASDVIEFKLAKDLKEGETLVLINRDMRMTLNDLILEKAEEYPKLKVLQSMVSLWVDTVKEGMIKEDHDDETLLRKMKEKGASIKSPLTIRHWVNGEVIGPRDLKNILRIAEIYKSDSLKKNVEAVAASITQMRGLHISIFRRAKNALVEGKSEEVEKLGIDLSDFAEAIEFFRVESIEKVGSIPIEMLDKIGGRYEI